MAAGRTGLRKCGERRSALAGDQLPHSPGHAAGVQCMRDPKSGRQEIGYPS